MLRLSADTDGTAFANSLLIMDRPTGPLPACPKCKSERTKIIGQTQKPVLKYFQCDACGHVYVPDEKRS
jgi:uncharacterized OB-fold protein